MDDRTKDDYRLMQKRSTQSLKNKLGEDGYKEHMGNLGKKSKRSKDSVDSLIRRIHVVAPTEGVEVEIRVRKL